VEKLVLVGSVGFGRAGSRQLRFLSLPVIGELARPSRFGTRMFLRQCLFDRALVTEELIELGLRGVNAPPADTPSATGICACTSSRTAATSPCTNAPRSSMSWWPASSLPPGA